MNRDWSEQNKLFQNLISKKLSFREGIDSLLNLRKVIFSTIENIVSNCPKDNLFQMPFPKVNGYHSKTIIYSIWHIIRIEDIVLHELILNDGQIYFKKYKEIINSPIDTTGNELMGMEIVNFSKQIGVECLMKYAKEVYKTTNDFLITLQYDDLKREFDTNDKDRVIMSKSVSSEEQAVWLIDYWCNKDIGGLLRMPFSRHWIMHTEAMLRIEAGLSNCK